MSIEAKLRLNRRWPPTTIPKKKCFLLGAMCLLRARSMTCNMHMTLNYVYSLFYSARIPAGFYPAVEKRGSF